MNTKCLALKIASYKLLIKYFFRILVNITFPGAKNTQDPSEPPKNVISGPKNLDLADFGKGMKNLKKCGPCGTWGSNFEACEMHLQIIFFTMRRGDLGVSLCTQCANIPFPYQFPLQEHATKKSNTLERPCLRPRGSRAG